MNISMDIFELKLSLVLQPLMDPCQGPQAPPGFQQSAADAAAPPAGSSLGIQGGVQVIGGPRNWSSEKPLLSNIINGC